MGAKTWMLVCAAGDPRPLLGANPMLDREATLALAKAMFPRDKLAVVADGDLSFTDPPDDHLYAGHFGQVAVIAASEFGIGRPSQLHAHFLQHGPGSRRYLHAMHSAVDWFAYACWSNGVLTRSLSLSPDSGIMEDVGARLLFEEPYWSGQRPVGEPGDDYPLPFHPLDLGEDALKALFGYCLEGSSDEPTLDPTSVPLLHLRRTRSRLKFWL